MPTENRSSNTEMVSVPREAVVQAAELLQEYNKCSIARDLRAILAQPAVQHQGEPVALPARKREFTDNGHALLQNLSWNACLDEIAKLGPLYSRPVQGEPVYQLRNTVVGNVWRDADKEAYDSAENLAEYERRVLYPHADPGEVERLRADAVTQKAIADEAWAEVEKCRENSRVITQQVDTLRAQLTEAQALIQRQPSFIKALEQFEADDGTFVRLCDVLGAISASAEPSAPVERDELVAELASLEINGDKPSADVPDDHDEFLDANASAALWLLLNVGRIRAALECKP